VLRGLEGNEARAWLARALAKQKKWEEAQALAKQTLAEAPLDPVASSALGQSLVGLKRYDEAIQRLGATIAAREEQDTRAEGALDYFWRGMAWSGKRETARMAVDFETFLHLAPNAPEAETVKRMLGAIR
jgi:tetratricopeptide (TPR) repeat protein